MALQQASPVPKFEASPTESFISLPGDNYPPLFAPSTPSSTINPIDMMTPQSFSEDQQTPQLPAIKEETVASPAPEDIPASSEKKQTKKRKSWGQVLPEPKTNLPPRKRAKTEDEKEQRRVERVLRNRRAAQSSRERKRLEVEALELRNKELEEMLNNAKLANYALVEELNRFRRDTGVVTRSSSPLNPLRDAPLSLSPELFSSQDGHNPLKDAAHLVDELINSTANPTVNPASLSPALSPVPDETQADEASKEEQSSEQYLATSPDLTQHPAEVLSDLQCHKSAKVPKSFQDSQTPMSPYLVWALQLRMMLLSASAILSACQRPLTQIAMSSKAGFSLLPAPQLLTTIIWLVTLPPASRVSQPSTPSTSTTSSTTRPTMSPLTLWQRATMPLRTTASSPKSMTLRFKSLKKILSSSPNLARPLMDATMEALRLVSEGCDSRVGDIGSESSATRDQVSELTQCLRGIVLPSREVLMTLLWALKVEERKIQRRNDEKPQLESGTPEYQSSHTKTFVLKVSGMKRSTQLDGRMANKRSRLA
uniref:BZIP domain-containing protein n=1 Tax=Photinus pyralis TaxID=7054 RepID=A0A1Y1K7N4_PHOPY